MSENRIRASQLNGALSRGPITPEGKANSAANSIRHGLLAETILVGRESRAKFQEIMDLLIEHFVPTDGVEQGLIEDMASAIWRVRRSWAIESHLLDSSMKKKTSRTELARLSDAFTELSSTPQLHLLHRYETRVNMHYQRAVNTLLRLRQAKLPNEPTKPLIPLRNPENEHPDSPGLDPNSIDFQPESTGESVSAEPHHLPPQAQQDSAKLPSEPTMSLIPLESPRNEHPNPLELDPNSTDFKPDSARETVSGGPDNLPPQAPQDSPQASQPHHRSRTRFLRRKPHRCIRPSPRGPAAEQLRRHGALRSPAPGPVI